MPFPVPWFKDKNNNDAIDPLLPSQEYIKPFLYNYDEYQTYDILWHIPFDYAFYTYLRRSLENYLPLLNKSAVAISPGFFRFNYYGSLTESDRLIYQQRASTEEALIFFDRFTPWDYPWAEDYSTKFFHFLRQYCCYVDQVAYRFDQTVGLAARIKDYSIGSNGLWTVEDNPRFIPFEETERFQSTFLPKFQGDPPYQLSFNCNLSENQTIIITWLEFYRADRGRCETIKRCQILNLKEGENQVTLFFQLHLCACSLVVSGGEEVSIIKEAIEKIDPGLLYGNFDKLLAEIAIFFGFFPNSKVVRIGEYRENNLIPLPDWYYYANLTYANNNYWKNSISIDISEDLGKPIYCTAVYNQLQQIIDLNFNLWGHTTLCYVGGYPGKLSFKIEDINISSFSVFTVDNLFKKLTRNENSQFYEIFTEEEQEGLNKILEESLIQSGIALSKEFALTIIDARKMLELRENA
ncbi:MAG: hypothetical protein ACRC2R_02735 [Xenococcaceae cyanobacterium]